MAAIELNSTPLISDANLVAYYRMEQNSNDTKGSYNGTDANMSYASTTPKFNYYGIFNGTSSKIDLGTNAALSPTAITVSAWVYCPNFTNIQEILSRLPADESAYYTFNISTSGKLRSYCTGSSGGFVLAGTGAGQIAIATDTWTHIAWSYSSTQGLITYINGQQDAIVAAGGTMNAASTNTYIGWEYGNNRWFGSGSNGLMDDLAIFSRALTATEISNLYSGNYPAGPANLKSLNTNIKSNIKLINSNLIANCKSYNTNI